MLVPVIHRSSRYFSPYPLSGRLLTLLAAISAAGAGCVAAHENQQGRSLTAEGWELTVPTVVGPPSRDRDRSVQKDGAWGAITPLSK